MGPHSGIGRTIALYGQLLDDRRFDEWGQLFAVDATWSMPGTTFEGRRAIVEGVSAMEPPVTGLVRHFSFTPIIELDAPDRARAWTDLMAMFRASHDAAWSIAAIGRYHDELVLIDGFWLFAKRSAHISPDEGPAMSLVTSRRGGLG